mgnify:CR=1 FL=1
MNIFKKQKNILNTDFFYILLIVLISLLLSAHYIHKVFTGLMMAYIIFQEIILQIRELFQSKFHH